MAGVPMPREMDPGAEMCERRWKVLTARVHPEVVWQHALRGLIAARQEPGNGFGALWHAMRAHPLRDRDDLEGMKHSTRVRDKVACADAVIEALGRAWLEVAAHVEDTPF
jgi:hypothetical protein